MLRYILLFLLVTNVVLFTGAAVYAQSDNAEEPSGEETSQPDSDESTNDETENPDTVEDNVVYN